jgi:hypothetical protein
LSPPSRAQGQARIGFEGSTSPYCYNCCQIWFGYPGSAGPEWTPTWQPSVPCILTLARASPEPPPGIGPVACVLQIIEAFSCALDSESHARLSRCAVRAESGRRCPRTVLDRPPHSEGAGPHNPKTGQPRSYPPSMGVGTWSASMWKASKLPLQSHARASDVMQQHMQCVRLSSALTAGICLRTCSCTVCTRSVSALLQQHQSSARRAGMCLCICSGGRGTQVCPLCFCSKSGRALAHMQRHTQFV